jgi:hypothetical protein
MIFRVKEANQKEVPRFLGDSERQAPRAARDADPDLVNLDHPIG